MAFPAPDQRDTMRSLIIIAVALGTACSCTGLHRGTPPTRSAPVFFRLNSSECPRYHIEVREDGTLEYNGLAFTSFRGAGWKTLSRDAVAWLHRLEVPSSKPTDRVEFDQGACRGFGARLIGLSLRRGTNWLFTCADPSSLGEVERQVLEVLGATDWVALRPRCVME